MRNGVRLTLERVDVSEEQVEYRCAFAMPECDLEARLAIRIADGEVQLSGEHLDQIPEWQRELARALARTAWRQRETSGWPRRVTRWRAER